MQSLPLPMTGSCRCGQVRIEARTAPIMTSACHCTGCQKMTGSAYSLSTMIPAEAFSVTAGTPVVGGLHGPDQHHMFCPHCMSWMFTRIEGVDFFVNVRAPMFDGVDWPAPYMETMTSEKLRWVEVPATRSYAGFPPMEDFGQLLAEFAETL